MIKIKNKSLLSVLMIILLFISAKSRADDGTFFSSGDQLFPLQETSIELKHEILRFSYDGKNDRMKVDVMFEFYNPGPKKDLLVGFVTPASSNHEDTAQSYIYDLKVYKDGALLPFQCSYQDEEKFYKDPNGMTDTYDAPYWAYSFTASFDQGSNIIYHSYSFSGDVSDVGLRDFTYRLSTGNKWANKEIGSLELFIDPGINKLFAVPLTFDSAANNAIHWETIGLIKSQIDTTIDINECVKSLYCFSKGGYLYLNQEHVKASIDLNIALLLAPIFSEEMKLKMNWFNIPDFNEFPGCSQITLIDSSATPDTSNNLDEDSKYEIRQLNIHQLTILKNIPFALAGYDFKNPELKAYFNQFIWYFPDPNVPDSYDILTPVQQKLVSYVLDQIKLLTKK